MPMRPRRPPCNHRVLASPIAVCGGIVLLQQLQESGEERDEGDDECDDGEVGDSHGNVKVTMMMSRSATR